MNRHIVAIALTLAVTGACDPQDGAPAQASQKNASRTDAAAEPAKGAPLVGAAADPKAPAGDFTSCLLGCDAAKTNHADKAACRYNCEGAGGTATPGAAPGVGADPVGYFVSCTDRCSADGTPSEACAGACKTAVAGAAGAPSAAVLDTLGTCLGTCRTAKHVSETNHATCALNCAQIARVAGPATPVAVTTRP